MFLTGSRYQKARSFTADDGEVSFSGVRPREIGPATGVVEHVVRQGERLDALARNYYNDSRLGWRILDANPELLFAGELDDMAGQTLLIPKVRET